MNSDLAALAERQWRDYLARSPGSFFADPHRSLDLAEAYWLQDAVSRLRVDAGDRIAGYKVGCTGPGTTAQFGMAGPIRGYLFQSEIRGSGDTLASETFASLAIEGEMALRIGEHGRPVAAFPVIELHNFVFRGERKTLVELVANNGLNAGVVLPPEALVTSQGYPATASTLEVSINGRLIGAGNLWPLAGDAEASLEWLRDHLHEHGLALSGGDLVLAGTPLGLYPVGPGDYVAVSLDGMTLVECQVA